MSMPASEMKVVGIWDGHRYDRPAYRLAGIRRRGLAETDPRYWFMEFNPKSGLGIVTDRLGRLSLQRGLLAKNSLISAKGGIHFVRVVRDDGQIYWEGHCLPGEHELELAFVELDGAREIPVDNPQPPLPERFWTSITWSIIAAGCVVWATALWLMFGR